MVQSQNTVQGRGFYIIVSTHTLQENLEMKPLKMKQIKRIKTGQMQRRPDKESQDQEKGRQLNKV